VQLVQGRIQAAGKDAEADTQQRRTA